MLFRPAPVYVYICMLVYRYPCILVCLYTIAFLRCSARQRVQHSRLTTDSAGSPKLESVNDRLSNMPITHSYMQLYAPIWAILFDPAFFLLFFSKNPTWGEVQKNAGWGAAGLFALGIGWLGIQVWKARRRR